MLICGACGGLVKSLSDLAAHLRCEEKPLELVVVENTDLQQLQAKIRAVVSRIDVAVEKCDGAYSRVDIANELRELSAIMSTKCLPS